MHRCTGFLYFDPSNIVQNITVTEALIFLLFFWAQADFGIWSSIASCFLLGQTLYFGCWFIFSYARSMAWNNCPQTESCPIFETL